MTLTAVKKKENPAAGRHAAAGELGERREASRGAPPPSPAGRRVDDEASKAALPAVVTAQKALDVLASEISVVGSQTIAGGVVPAAGERATLGIDMRDRARTARRRGNPQAAGESEEVGNAGAGAVGANPVARGPRVEVEPGTAVCHGLNRVAQSELANFQRVGDLAALQRGGAAVGTGDDRLEAELAAEERGDAAECRAPLAAVADAGDGPVAVDLQPRRALPPPVEEPITIGLAAREELRAPPQRLEEAISEFGVHATFGCGAPRIGRSASAPGRQDLRRSANGLSPRRGCLP